MDKLAESISQVRSGRSLQPETTGEAIILVDDDEGFSVGFTSEGSVTDTNQYWHSLLTLIVRFPNGGRLSAIQIQVRNGLSSGLGVLQAPCAKTSRQLLLLAEKVTRRPLPIPSSTKYQDHGGNALPDLAPQPLR